ncbi:replicase [Lysinibacillus sphaericus]|uniref:Replicase domain-containing protein n=1 Tax=Lysinibacillus sphaericus OT4b.31 TaxID=1285586 RepID=R7Z8W7_LYSSH|nr:replicase [Lysinibacillus sphaericus]EON70474.1 replicase domain-containing protein [Lysinibacillus sphaericus OT4b.31]
MTTIIGGKRMCGKTTELLKQSEKEGHRILVAHDQVVDILEKEAKKLGLNIPPPVSIQRLLRDNSFKGESLLVDEVEWLLSKMTGCRIVSMSTSATMIEKEAINREDVDWGII